MITVTIKFRNVQKNISQTNGTVIKNYTGITSSFGNSIQIENYFVNLITEKWLLSRIFN